MLRNLLQQKSANKGPIRILISFNHSSDVRLALVSARLAEEAIPFEVIDEGIGTLEPYMSAFGGPKIIVHQRYYVQALAVLEGMDLTPHEIKSSLTVNYLWILLAILIVVTIVYWWYSSNKIRPAH